MRNKIQVGYAYVDLTPDYSVPLAGSGASDNRMSEDKAYNLGATVVVFRDIAGELGGLMCCDFVHMDDEPSAFYPRCVSFFEKYGVKEGNVIISSSHCHSAPDIFSYNPVIRERYLPDTFEKLEDAVKRAFESCMNDAGRDIYAGDAIVEHANFVRRGFAADGTFVGVNIRNVDENGVPKKAVRAENEPDKRLRIVKFVGEGVRDIILINWPAHVTLTPGKTLSGDYPAMLRDLVREEMGADLAFSQGASGNVIPSPWTLPDEQYRRNAPEYARVLCDALKGADDFEKLDSCATISSNSADFDVYYGKETDKDISEAIRIFEDFATCRVPLAEANIDARAHGFDSVYECGRIRHLQLFCEGDTLSFPLRALRLGDIAFAGAPYEMFCQNSISIMERSKAKMTFVITHATSSMGYLPAEECYAVGGYEVPGLFKKGSSERLADKLVEMINLQYE